MADAWIYGDQGSEGTSRLLAELGFSPHRVAANGTLRPPEGASRAPALALVLSTGDEQPSCAEVCARLAADEELAEVPVIVALPADGLGAGVGVAEGHELLVEPFTAEELQARIARARRVVNGIDHDDIVAQVNAALVDMPEGDGRIPRVSPATVGPSLAIDDDSEQVHLAIGGRSLPREHVDREALDVVNHIFGGGLSSR
ncbi:MAG: insulinase family protein, partial [Actinobacteria bacterium]|nr:insulinase family protein [Actinomycetota bacterium]